MGQEGPLPWRGRGQEVPFIPDSFSSSSCPSLILLYCEGTFSNVVDSLVQEILFRGIPPDPQIVMMQV